MIRKLLFLALFALACHADDELFGGAGAGGGGGGGTSGGGGGSGAGSHGILSKDDNTFQLPKKLDPFGWLKGNGEFPSLPGFDSQPRPLNLLKTTDLLGSITELVGALLQTVRGLLKGIGGGAFNHLGGGGGGIAT